MRWSKLASDTRVYKYPGAHDELLIDPQVAPLATQLNAALTSTERTPTIAPLAPTSNASRVADPIRPAAPTWAGREQTPLGFSS